MSHREAHVSYRELKVPLTGRRELKVQPNHPAMRYPVQDDWPARTDVCMLHWSPRGQRAARCHDVTWPVVSVRSRGPMCVCVRRL